MEESKEYNEELIAQWTEVHKKSMVTLLILLALEEKPRWSREIEIWFEQVSGWKISERGLHRTLKRMARLGLIEYHEVSAPKTGVKRKKYALTQIGTEVLINIKNSSLKYLRDTTFIKSIAANRL